METELGEIRTEQGTEKVASCAGRKLRRRWDKIDPRVILKLKQASQFGSDLVARAIMIGRFQPIHKGHIEVIKQVLQEVDELIIGIGSSQEGHTLENLFTAAERVLMIEKALEEVGIDRSHTHIVKIPDVHNDATWVSHAVSLTPQFSVVYSRNPWVQRLFKEAGYEVRTPPPYKRKEYQGEEIRNRMLKGERWEDLVPKVVLEVMREIKAVERLKNLSKNK